MGDDQPARQMPAGLIEQKNGVPAWRDFGCDLGEVQIHRLGVAGRLVRGLCPLRFQPRAPGMFFKILDRPVFLLMMARTRGELAIAHRPQFSAERLLGDYDLELLVQPLAKVVCNEINRSRR